MDAKRFSRRATELARHPRTRKIAIWFVAIVVAIGVLGGLVAPPLLRGKLASVLTDKLHRQVSIEQIRINPYALTATVRGFVVKEPQSQATAISFDELHLNLELWSLFRLAAVVKELRLVRPYINLVRNEDRTYNYQDLIKEFTSAPSEPPAPSGPPPRFALNNIEVIDGKIDFDDRPEQTKHAITAIHIGVPFISSLPSQADIRVQPSFSANVNGSPLVIQGEAKPFKETHESTIHLNIEKLQIAKYLEYSPVELNFKVPSGEINGRLTASFSKPENQPAVLTMTGNVAVQELAMEDKSEAPLLKMPALELDVGGIEVIAGKANIKALKAQGLEVHVRRSRDGKINLANLVETAAPATPAEPKTSGSPFIYHIAEISLEGGKLSFSDETPDNAYRTQLNNVRILVKELTNEAEKKASAEISFESDSQEKVNHSGSLQLTPLLIEGKLTAEALRPGGFRSYYQSTLAPEIQEGFLDLATAYSIEKKNDRTEIKFAELNATLRNLRLQEAKQREPLWRLPSLAVKDASVDLTNKVIAIGSIEGREGSGFVLRNQDGSLNYAHLIKTKQSSESGPQEPKKKPEPAKKEESGWKIEAARIALERFKINFEDRGNKTPSKINLSELSLRAEKFTNAPNQRAKTTLQTRINNKGLLRLTGSAGANPARADFTVESRDIDLAAFQPYLEDRVNFVLTGGRLGTKGTLRFDGSGSGPAKVSYQGAAQVAEFATAEKDGVADLLKWKSLALDGFQFASAPMNLRIDEITLDGFYSHLVLGADGKFNLQKLAVDSTDNKPEPTDKAGSAEKAPEPPDSAAPAERPVTIGKINLKDGEIAFEDFFIKPNYSAHLNAVQGAISELKPETPGDLVLDAKLDDAAPVDVRGKINPLAKDLYLDIAANAKEIELSRFTPYSVKYIGYGIQGGKLSFNVKYKVENRKLTAENQIILNQLIFGERVESPTAIKAPVLLAVALLKDRNGVIDVNLPISGSLDDPQFSVGGIVLRLFLNIITRAVTAPFTLIGSLFGGGSSTSGEELSYIEFDPGRATLSQAAEAKIKTLATAMNNRPALKLEITGRVDPANDLEGLKRVILERKVKAQKLKELARQGAAPKSVDDVSVGKDEYERYLKAAYGAEDFPKPRNVIGLAKDLPVPEMESLMLQNTKVTEADLADLANRRAQIVRDRLLATGQVTADRVSIAAGKQTSSEDKEKTKAKASRVDFSLR
jgi:uncharacterized protein involved in outer membrane biogenesis